VAGVELTATVSFPRSRVQFQTEDRIGCSSTSAQGDHIGELTRLPLPYLRSVSRASLGALLSSKLI
jgi:hypothetical protein